jgi:hypothetical protein
LAIGDLGKHSPREPTAEIFLCSALSAHSAVNGFANC